MASRHPLTGEKLVEGENADRRGGSLRPRMPELDISGATKSLDDFGTTLQEALPGEEQQLSSEAGINIGQVQGAQKEAVEKLGLQRGAAERQTESAIAEARRVGDELLRGIQARFGGTTGTGAFTSEIIGRDIAGNIAENRSILQQRMAELDQAEISVDRDAQQQVFSINTRLEEAKQQLRRELKERLAEINVRKGELEMEKSKARMGVMMQAAETSRMLEMQARDQSNAIEQMRESAKLDLQDLRERLAISSSFGGFNTQSFEPTSTKLIEGVNADRRGGVLRAR